jgi:hypothetical protein
MMAETYLRLCVLDGSPDAQGEAHPPQRSQFSKALLLNRTPLEHFLLSVMPTVHQKKPVR